LSSKIELIYKATIYSGKTGSFPISKVWLFLLSQTYSFDLASQVFHDWRKQGTESDKTAL